VALLVVDLLPKNLVIDDCLEDVAMLTLKQAEDALSAATETTKDTLAEINPVARNDIFLMAVDRIVNQRYERLFILYFQAKLNMSMISN